MAKQGGTRPGAGRKPIHEEGRMEKQIPLQMTCEMHRRIVSVKWLHEDNRSINAWIREAIQEKIERTLYGK